ncbi:garnet [Thecamonas trahens ATCC 50062]|uniref:Garnet n=1 Tax=Thecamonas trahens ATCC 50062 TaxID=461836 RepID=A0A0L0DI43_THETB|nr:garnet [Thecamonas trahens ATCC 50062]KNC51771.1 garnet [Thecamonas trahens ATCC 50062]|eukprot:XP_013755644.1 garnet [Thecamonas trahens ATCC 50062]
MPIFQKSVTDLVRGIRSNKKSESEYINAQIAAIKEELKQPQLVKKVVAIQKLTYLQMMGYDMAWAAFNVIEVMSAPKFAYKRVGYLAASQSFNPETEVLMLATNLFKKDFAAANQYESGMAINCLANVCTEDLARDLASDIVAMLNNSKPYLRKKAVLVLYKIFLQFPEALRPAFPRLKSKLEDSDVSVISAAVNVICELARKNPKNYLSLAPVFFKLLTVSNNNWMLIKIVKLLGALTPHEPRLAKKLIGPMTNLINTTPAMSLLYECINTCTIGLNQHLPVIQLCVAKLRAFVEDPDQNLKYLGLLALGNIMVYHPRAVAEHRDLILKCLGDEDITIRTRALNLIPGIVSKKNLVDIVRTLMAYVPNAEGAYRDAIVAQVIRVCSQDSYAALRDFEWYISILVEMTRIRGTKHGRLIADQFLDVAIRVRVVRPYVVQNMVNLLLDPRFLADNPKGKDSISEVLYAAAWIVGEFAAELNNDYFVRVMQAIMQPRVSTLPPRIQGVYLQNAVKLFAEAVARFGLPSAAALTAPVDGDDADAQPAAARGLLIGDAAAPNDESPTNGSSAHPGHEVTNELASVFVARIPAFLQSTAEDVQERACSFQQVLAVVREALVAGTDPAIILPQVRALFKGKMNPVAPNAQSKVPVPAGLNLDAWINSPPDEALWESMYGDQAVSLNDSSAWGASPGMDPAFGAADRFVGMGSDTMSYGSTPAGGQSARSHDINYLGSGSSDPRIRDIDVSAIPIETLTIGANGEAQFGASGRRRRRRRRGAGLAVNAPAVKPVEYQVDTTYDMPEGISLEEDNPESEEEDEIAKALNIDLSAPLGADEVLPQRQHRVAGAPSSAAAAAQPAAQPVTIGRSGRRRRRRGAAAATVDTAQDAPAARQASTTSLIDLGAGPASPAAPAPAPAAPAASPIPVVDSSMDSPAPAPAAPAGKRRRRRRGGAAAAGSAAAPSATAASPGAAAPGGFAPKPMLKLLCGNPEFFINYTAQPNLTQPTQLLVAVNCANATADATISGIEFTVLDSMNMQLIKSPGADSLKTDITLFPGVNNVVPMTFAFQSFEVAQKLKGSVSYIKTMQSGGSTAGNLDFAFEFPPSSFVVAVPCTATDFAAICGGPTAHSAAKFTSTSSFTDAVSAIMGLLHVSLVDASPSAVSLYGRSVHNHHVALLVKDLGSGNMSIDCKCSDAGLGSQLVDEVVAHFDLQVMS